MVPHVTRWSFWKTQWRRQERFWTRDIWDANRRPAEDPVRELGYVLARIVYIVVDGFRTERIRLRAAALTYMTLLSLVPALAVVFSLFTAFGGLRDVQEKLQRFVVSTLAVGEQQDVVLGYLNQFVSQVHAGRLGAVGVIILCFTVIATLANIETAFNDIWGVTKGRGWLERFQVYWPLVTIAPLLLGVSLSMTASVQASETVQRLIETLPALGFVSYLVPVLLTCVSLTLLYFFMPNTRVPLPSAMVGGAVAGTLWSVAQQLYAVYAANAISYSAIYGSLGAIPLFIIWLYVSWTVAMLGATVTFAVQSAGTYEPERDVSQREKEYAAARLMLAVAAHYRRGDGVISIEKLLDEARISARLARQVLEALVRDGLLAETMTPDGVDVAYVPSRPLESTTLGDVVNVLQVAGAEPYHAAREDDQVGIVAKDRLLNGEAARTQALSNMSLLALVESRHPLRLAPDPTEASAR